MLDASRTALEPQEANRLAREVLAVDISIISVGIISNNGAPLGGSVADAHRHSVSEDPKNWEISAFKGALIMANAKAFDRSSSAVESVVIIRKESKTLFIWMPQHAVIIAAVLEKAANGTELSNKIRKLFKIE